MTKISNEKAFDHFQFRLIRIPFLCKSICFHSLSGSFIDIFIILKLHKFSIFFFYKKISFSPLLKIFYHHSYYHYYYYHNNLHIIAKWKIPNLWFSSSKVFFFSVYDLLNELNGGYIAPNNEPPSDMTPLVGALLKISGTPLFDLYVDADLYDHTKMAIFLDLPKKYKSDMFLDNVPVSGYHFSLLTIPWNYFWSV